jgi:hypothetical protein
MEEFLWCLKDQGITLSQEIARDDANFVKSVHECNAASILLTCIIIARLVSQVTSIHAFPVFPNGNIKFLHK